MDLDTYLVFLTATVVVLLIPGPTVMMVVGSSLTQGRRAAVPLALGVGLGNFVAAVASLAGLGMLLAASAELFAVFKWAGAAYLVYLGVKAWRADPAAGTGPDCVRPASNRTHLLNACLVTATNPKAIVFLCAFLPQFIAPDRPQLPQLLLLEITVQALTMVVALFYALLAVKARRIVANPRSMKTINRIGGTTLIGAGILTAALKRA
ncbi:Lysine exporter protein (LYSE/YGGA) [Pseudodesulfovibrio mercurii]|uniref:Lysine exporter protein (LYSE/YGGA) n=1 Tax=Pseudodesulfovibrio mercurii TaxID=641491 RepID=F0JG07_9BACT|nr:LysE family translocator [Pseudodesulfovibrio mercurii]EGB15003.1 Lysine exporter protein (LYSE/YGGA) [Pseudodesulfovibrio mercurii]